MTGSPSGTAVRNVLLITLDQFRGDSFGAAGHPLVRTPNLDRLCVDGVRLARHHSQASPCSPGRASLYTGMYQMNHRVVGNGAPLDRRFDNVALAARRAGYEPAVFGYTDQAIDPRDATGPDDPRLFTYEGQLPGFDAVLDLSQGSKPWVAWLDAQGVDVTGGEPALLATEPDRPAELSESTFLTDRALEWLDAQTGHWFAHLSYLRPHPPYAAAGEWATAYDPATVELPIPMATERHPLHDMALGITAARAPEDEPGLRHLRAQYYGMISEVDHQLGRVWAALEASGAWDETLIVVTSDHGEMLGDHGLVQKLGYWEQSYHVLGIIRDPSRPAGHGTVVDDFTENVDVMPTICEAIGAPVPVQCDGYPLTVFLDGGRPERWRTAAHWEFDWRGYLVGLVGHEWPWDRELEGQHLACLRTADHQYVQFGDGSWLCFDLEADPTGHTLVDDPEVVLPLAQEMLTWRSTHADRTLTDMVLTEGGIGRWPAMPQHWGT